MKNLLLFLLLIICSISCHSSGPIQVSDQFKQYWYSGKAEITSYKIKQSRYGEYRDGHTVHIYVTENLNSETQIKTDRDIKNKLSVLKLNKSKKFLTGIYPYSVMTSVFSPLQGKETDQATKLSFSAQEWCGHVYAQLNNSTGNKFNVISHSYFESEGDEDLKITKSALEDEVLLKLRKSPKILPVGKLKMIPSLEFFRFNHIKLQAFNAIAKLDTKKGTYQISYTDLKRVVTIKFNPIFPFTINSWTISMNGKLNVQAVKIKTISTTYWNKNRNIDQSLRSELGLESAK